VTVKGSGYKPTQGLYLTMCPDVPMGEFDFGYVSRTCTAGAKLISPNPSTPTMVKLNADGTFEATIELKKNDAWSSVALYTLNDHRAQGDRSQDVKVPVSFATPGEPEPVPVEGTLDNDEVEAGAAITLTGEGFSAEETFTARIVDGATLPGGTAGADGKVSYSFTVPADLEAGDYRVELTGSTSRHVVYADFSVVAAGGELPEGPIEFTHGALDWGVKEAFRTYVNGPIAHGEVTTQKPATQNPDGTVRFDAEEEGDLVVDLDAETIEADFAGGVRFYGHNGALNLTLANPRVEVEGNEGSLVVDVTSVPFAGMDPDAEPAEPVVTNDVAFAELDLTDAEVSIGDEDVTFSGVATTLTAEGAEVFGELYVAGTDMDPLTLQLGFEEIPAAQPGDEEPPVANPGDDVDGDGDTVTPVNNGSALPHTGARLELLGMGLVLMLAGAAAMLATRRRPRAGRHAA
jgi:hypothetical protein